jgi:peptide-methionine (S)-S-oxide reductase
MTMNHMLEKLGCQMRQLRGRWCAAALGAVLVTVGCSPGASAEAKAAATPVVESAPVVNGQPMAYALFAGGCFWCMEADFEKLAGVLEVESGYTDGHTQRPTYQQVSAGGTGHVEAVRVIYDPAKVSYAQLVAYFWRHIDPTVKDRQFCDIGDQYRTGIYWQNESEHQVAEASRDELLKSGRFKTIYTELAAATPFYLAEDYHQDYYKKNPVRYNYYRLTCGRDARVKQVWQ